MFNMFSMVLLQIIQSGQVVLDSAKFMLNQSAGSVAISLSMQDLSRSRVVG
jgi:hypothetical protein